MLDKEYKYLWSEHSLVVYNRCGPTGLMPRKALYLRKKIIKWKEWHFCHLFEYLDNWHSLSNPHYIAYDFHLLLKGFAKGSAF